MNIEIHDAALEARIQKLLRTTGSSSVAEVLLHMVETQEEQDRWLLENRAMVNAKIKPVSINSTAVKGFRKINWMLI